MRGSPGLSAGGKAQVGAPWAEGVVRTGRLWVSPKNWQEDTSPSVGTVWHSAKGPCPCWFTCLTCSWEHRSDLRPATLGSRELGRVSRGATRGLASHGPGTAGGAGRGSRASQSVQPGQRQPAGLDKWADLLAGLLAP